METFQKEISYKSKQFFSDKVNAETQANGWETVRVNKTATFKELDDLDRSQHKLHWQIISVFTEAKNVDGQIKLESNKVYEVTIEAIKQLMVVDETNFKASDKEEFLNDSGALWHFGYWLLGEKLLVFFSNTMQS